jgi:hypothetical protein
VTSLTLNGADDAFSSVVPHVLIEYSSCTHSKLQKSVELCCIQHPCAGLKNAAVELRSDAVFCDTKNGFVKRIAIGVVRKKMTQFLHKFYQKENYPAQ